MTPHNESFTNKIESVQYNAALAITGPIKSTSRERLYQELGLESLCDRQWYRRLTMFFNIIKDKSPSYLTNYLPNLQFSHNVNRNNLFIYLFIFLFLFFLIKVLHGKLTIYK